MELRDETAAFSISTASASDDDGDNDDDDDNGINDMVHKNLPLLFFE